MPNSSTGPTNRCGKQISCLFSPLFLHEVLPAAAHDRRLKNSLFLLQVVPVGSKGSDFLASRCSLPTKVLLRLVSSEASRLSRSNRQKTVTLQELAAAVALVQQKTGTRAAA